MKTNHLIKIQLSEEDKETLSDIFCSAISSVMQDELEADSAEDSDYYLKKAEKFKDLRQRIKFKVEK